LGRGQHQDVRCGIAAAAGTRFRGGAACRRVIAGLAAVLPGSRTVLHRGRAALPCARAATAGPSAVGTPLDLLCLFRQRLPSGELVAAHSGGQGAARIERSPARHRAFSDGCGGGAGAALCRLAHRYARQPSDDKGGLPGALPVPAGAGAGADTAGPDAGVAPAGRGQRDAGRGDECSGSVDRGPLSAPDLRLPCTGCSVLAGWSARAWPGWRCRVAWRRRSTFSVSPPP